MNFDHIKQAVRTQWARMQSGQVRLYRIQLDNIWETYLAAFPAGSNPMYKERTEHDCFSCRSFVKWVGDVVSVSADGKVETIWGGACEDPAYQTVLTKMNAAVLAAPIVDIFLHFERSAGIDRNHDADGVLFEHFRVEVDRRHYLPMAEIPGALARARDDRNVFARGCVEITQDALDTASDILPLIYRGPEYVGLLKKFINARARVLAGASTWHVTGGISSAVCRVNNGALGTLLTDLSSGMDTEAATSRWEKVMAPTNYKRPTALVTPMMLKKAEAEVNKLGHMRLNSTSFIKKKGADDTVKVCFDIVKHIIDTRTEENEATAEHVIACLREAAERV